MDTGSAWVVFFSYSGLFGGSERILLDRLARLGEGAILCCPPGPLADHARAAGVRVRELSPNSLVARRSVATRIRALADAVHLAAQLRAITAELAPEVMVLWGMRTALAALVPSRGHAPRVFVHTDLLPAGTLVRGLIRRAARRCAAVAVLSEAIGAELPGVKCEVIAAGVDLEAIRPEPVPTAPSAVTVGAIVGWKRPDLALEIVARAAATLPDLRLAIVGAPLVGDPEGDALLATLRARCAARDLAGRVTFTGHQADVGPMLRGAACMLHCSDAEPFGLVLVEALATGRPVIAPRSGGVTDIVDSSCGRLYGPGDAVAGAAALVDVLADHSRTQELGARARQRAEDRFDLERTAARFASLLHRVRR